jgi:hypothetical protein
MHRTARVADQIIIDEQYPNIGQGRCATPAGATSRIRAWPKFRMEIVKRYPLRTPPMDMDGDQRICREVLIAV